MDDQSRLEDLKAVAEKLSIEIETADLSDHEISIHSGHCKVKGKNLIILDKNLSPGEQIDIILKTFQSFDTETIYVPSWIRERLEE